MITIGSHKLPTSRPVDLDAALVASTGCNASEHQAMLERGGSAAQVVRVLAPFLAKDAPFPGELAAAVEPDALLALRRDVIALLAPPAPAKSEKTT